MRRFGRWGILRAAARGAQVRHAFDQNDRPLCNTRRSAAYAPDVPALSNCKACARRIKEMALARGASDKATWDAYRELDSFRRSPE